MVVLFMDSYVISSKSWYDESFNSIHWERCVVVSHCGLICCFSRANDIEHVYCACRHCLSSLVGFCSNHLFILTGLFMFLLLRLESSLYILNLSLLSDMVCKYFLTVYIFLFSQKFLKSISTFILWIPT